MSSRSYLSIGDVLTLLRAEFPDVTISKIRFLESQGLVNPERTPSGYRKFYEADVARLRWVLRQQREHFLPLRVIKDRLDEDPDVIHDTGGFADRREAGEMATVGGGVSEKGDPIGESGAASVVAITSSSSDHPGGGERPVSMPERPVLTALPSTGGAANSDGADDSLPRRTDVGAGNRRSTVGPTSRPARRGNGPRSVVATIAGSTPVGTAPSDGSPTDPETSRNDARSGDGGAVGPLSLAPGVTSEVPTENGEEPTPAGTQAGNSDAPGGGASGSPAADQAVDGPVDESRMSVDELATRAELPVETLRELQSYGLLPSVRVGGKEYFGSEALAVARLSVEMGRFGLEARHMKLYRTMADRELGFLEQVVVPMSRQRNPEAKEQASATAEELVALGHRLRLVYVTGGLDHLLKD